MDYLILSKLMALFFIVLIDYNWFFFKLYLYQAKESIFRKGAQGAVKIKNIYLQFSRIT